MAASAAQPFLPSTTHHPVEIDTSVAHASRIYDYLLGGTNNFAVDREAAERMAAAFYGGMDVPRADVRANRAFLVRAVHHLAADAGIRQFLDIGTGIPNDDNVHAVAQAVAPESRIVYVDYDRMVQAHAQVLLRGSSVGATDFVVADLRDPDRILQKATATLDLAQPIALVLVGILHLIPDVADKVVAQLLDALPSGSYMVISHLAADINADEMAEVAKRLRQHMYEPFVLRDRDEISRFLDGLELLEPGLVPVDEWRPSGTLPARVGSRVTPIYGAVGRKP